MARQFIYHMQGLTKAYSGRKVIENINLSFYPDAKIGVLGPNGSGKSTLLRIMAGLDAEFTGEAWIADGATRGFLSQEPQLDPAKDVKGNVMDGVAAKQTILDRYNEVMMNYSDETADEAARLQDDIDRLNLWDLDSQVEQAMDALRCPPGDMDVNVLSGGERRRVALCRLLLEQPDLLLLDEPTNHLDADSINWLRGFLKSHDGGLVIISHDVELLGEVVNKVWFLDATRGELDGYNMSWHRYLEARATDEKRRRRERANAEKKASALQQQAAKLGAKATKAVAAKNMARRAEQMLADLDETRQADKVARISFPSPASCGRTPLAAENLSKAYGSLEIFTGVDLAVDRGSKVVVLGLNGAGKTTLLRLLGGLEKPNTGRIVAGHGLRLGYYAQEHETLDHDASVWDNIRHLAPDTGEQELRNLLGTFLFTGEQLGQGAGTLSGGEKTRLALAGLVSSAANVLLLDEPTNNLDPASREQVL
jgi:ATPase subunit of ABC transporter with duplicated ATPase domains